MGWVGTEIPRYPDETEESSCTARCIEWLLGSYLSLVSRTVRTRFTMVEIATYALVS
jgi:hypothetical protein